MPPKTSKYGKGPDGYSTNPATRRVRARIAKFDPEQREAHRIYTREYTALWQACNRFARRDEYKRAPVKQRRQMLLNHLRGIIEKRRQAGKDIHGIKPETVVENQLRKEIAVMRKDGLLPAAANNDVDIKDLLASEDEEGDEDDDAALELAQEEMDAYDYNNMILGSIARVEQDTTTKQDMQALSREICALRKDVRILARHVVQYQTLLGHPFAQRAQQQHPAMRRRHRSLSPSAYMPPPSATFRPRRTFLNDRGRSALGGPQFGRSSHENPPAGDWYADFSNEAEEDDNGHDDIDLDDMAEHHHFHGREQAMPHGPEPQLHLDPSFITPQQPPRRPSTRAPVAMMDPHEHPEQSPLLPHGPPASHAPYNMHQHYQQQQQRVPVSSADTHHGATPRSSMLMMPPPAPPSAGTPRTGQQQQARPPRHPSQPVTPYYPGAATPSLFSAAGPAVQYPDPPAVHHNHPHQHQAQQQQHAFANGGGVMHNPVYHADFAQHPPQQQQDVGEQQHGTNPHGNMGILPEQ